MLGSLTIQLMRGRRRAGRGDAVLRLPRAQPGLHLRVRAGGLPAHGRAGGAARRVQPRGRGEGLCAAPHGARGRRARRAAHGALVFVDGCRRALLAWALARGGAGAGGEGAGGCRVHVALAWKQFEPRSDSVLAGSASTASVTSLKCFQTLCGRSYYAWQCTRGAHRVRHT